MTKDAPALALPALAPAWDFHQRDKELRHQFAHLPVEFHRNVESSRNHMNFARDMEHRYCTQLPLLKRQQFTSHRLSCNLTGLPTEFDEKRKQLRQVVGSELVMLMEGKDLYETYFHWPTWLGDWRQLILSLHAFAILRDKYAAEVGEFVVASSFPYRSSFVVMPEPIDMSKVGFLEHGEYPRSPELRRFDRFETPFQDRDGDLVWCWVRVS